MKTGFKQRFKKGIYFIGDPLFALNDNEMELIHKGKYNETHFIHEVSQGDYFDSDDNRYTIESGFFAITSIENVCEPIENGRVPYPHCYIVEFKKDFVVTFDDEYNILIDGMTIFVGDEDNLNDDGDEIFEHYRESF